MTQAQFEAEKKSEDVSTRKTKVSWMPMLAVVIVVAICLAWLYQITINTEKPAERTPKRVLLPAGFTGNIKVLYNIDGAEPLETEDGYLVIDVPLSGEVETSSQVEYGRAVDKFYRRLPGRSASIERESDEETNIVESDLDGYEKLNFEWVKVHKTGLVGDEDEFFQTIDELENRDPALEERYLANKDEAQRLMTAGEPATALPAYEIFIISDDFE